MAYFVKVDYFANVFLWFFRKRLCTAACRICETLINPYQGNNPFLYPLKKCENLCFSDIFKRYKNETVAWNRLKYSRNPLLKRHSHIKMFF